MFLELLQTINPAEVAQHTSLATYSWERFLSRWISARMAVAKSTPDAGSDGAQQSAAAAAAGIWALIKPHLADPPASEPPQPENAAVAAAALCRILPGDEARLAVEIVGTLGPAAAAEPAGRRQRLRLPAVFGAAAAALGAGGRRERSAAAEGLLAGFCGGPRGAAGGFGNGVSRGGCAEALGKLCSGSIEVQKARNEITTLDFCVVGSKRCFSRV